MVAGRVGVHGRIPAGRPSAQAGLRAAGIFRGTKLHILVAELRRAVRETRRADTRGISLLPQGTVRGHVLLSYIDDPFRLRPGEPISHAHTHDWESMQMATTFLELGYAVYVIRWSNQSFVPRKDYQLIVDSRMNLQRFASLDATA